jgi:hypothetical protein
MRPQGVHVPILDLDIGLRHCLGIIKRHLFAFVEQATFSQVVERLKLRHTSSALQESCRIEIGAEPAPVDLGNAYCNQ